MAYFSCQGMSIKKNGSDESLLVYTKGGDAKIGVLECWGIFVHKVFSRSQSHITMRNGGFLPTQFEGHPDPEYVAVAMSPPMWCLEIQEMRWMTYMTHRSLNWWWYYALLNEPENYRKYWGRKQRVRPGTSESKTTTWVQRYLTHVPGFTTEAPVFTSDGVLGSFLDQNQILT